MFTSSLNSFFIGQYFVDVQLFVCYDLCLLFALYLIFKLMVLIFFGTAFSVCSECRCFLDQTEGFLPGFIIEFDFPKPRFRLSSGSH